MISSIGNSTDIWEQYASIKSSYTTETKSNKEEETSEKVQELQGKQEGPPPAGPPPGTSQKSSSESKNDNQSLTDSDNEYIKLLLSEYDENTLTTDDANEIFSKIEEYGLKIDSTIKNAIDSNGFDAENLKNLASYKLKSENRPISNVIESMNFNSKKINITNEDDSEDIDNINQQAIQNMLNSYKNSGGYNSYLNNTFSING